MANPNSQNPLLVNYFRFELERVPNMVYFCQTVNLPGIGFGVANQPTTLGHPVKVPTGAFRFEDIELSFRVDENMANWLEIHEWIKTAGNYTDDINTLPYHKSIKPDGTVILGKTSDATLYITNSAYNDKLKVHFKRVFPQFLSGIEFSVSSPSSMEAIAKVKFSHTGYDIEHI